MIRIGADHKAVHASWQEVLDSGQFTEGKYTRLFEEAVEDYYGLHAAAVSSCGAGLFALMRQRSHMRVMVPANTFIATASMAREAGHHVWLVDAAEDDLSVGAKELSQALYSSGIEAFVLTHVGGWKAKHYDALVAECVRDGRVVDLFEDAAHALGVKGIGQKSEGAVFSLYPTKAMPVGDGGVVISRHKIVVDSVKRFRNYGKWNDPQGVIHYGAGFNLRMDEWTAVVAYHQMKRIGEIMERREAAADRLRAVVPPLYEGPGSNWYKYVAPADYPATRQTGKVYAATDQVSGVWGLTPLPNAARIAESHICLPIWEDAYKGMTPGQIEHYLQGGDYEGSAD